MDMSNSFYYFFSAVPQVLAAVLALFGVFVIFKIQTLKTRMFDIADELLNHPPTNARVVNDLTSIKLLKSAIRKDDIKELKTAIDSLDNEQFGVAIDRFDEIFKFTNNLIQPTIFYSYITAGIIVVSLSIIPFGYLILNNSCLLILIFTSVIGCLIICFSGFVSILKKSLGYKNR